MNWNDDAVDAVAKAPLFVRAIIRRKIQNYVSKQGRSTVTIEDVEELHKQAVASGDIEVKTEPESGEETYHGGITAKQIEKIVENTKVQVLSNSRFYEVKVCGGAFGCPRTLCDVRALTEKTISVIEEIGIPEAVEKRTKGPVLKHHKFCVSISGCPNGCSQPQIADFGVQGRARPAIGDGSCDGCGECIRICKENAIAVTSNNPVFDRERCIDCGDCVAVCPIQAIVMQQYGFSVLVGGKLGRHPKLAQTLYLFADEETLLVSLRVACEIFISEIQTDERFADAIIRIGIEELLRRIG